MPERGTLDVWFAIALSGIRLSESFAFPVTTGKISATLYERGEDFELHVHVSDTNERNGATVALRWAREMYERLLLTFAEHVELASPPRVTRSRFTEADGRAVATASHSADSLVARAQTTLPASTLTRFADDLAVRLGIPQPSTSAPLYGAITMHSMALQCDSKVVRFLALYAALSLVAVFKFGRGSQQKVDELLLTTNPALPVYNSSKNGTRETLYTKLRNDFIHAEDRRWDTTAAIGAIESHLAAFQKDSANVIRAV